MAIHDDDPDSDLTLTQIKLVGRLSGAEVHDIDNALLANTCDEWRKVARVVATTMSELPETVKGIPDVYYSQRVRKLVRDGLLECKGDLSYMRYSEVRKPCGKET